MKTLLILFLATLSIQATPDQTATEKPNVWLPSSVIPKMIQQITESPERLLNQSKLSRRLAHILQTTDPQALIQIRQEGMATSKSWHAVNLKTKKLLTQAPKEGARALITLTFPHFGDKFTAVSEDFKMIFQFTPSIKLLSVTKLEGKNEQIKANKTQQTKR